MFELWSVLNDVMRADPWLSPFSTPAARPSSMLHADVAETDGDYWITAELPGVPLENVTLELEADVLTLSAVKRPIEEAGPRNHQHVERRYGTFSRAFRLPETVNKDEVQATMKDGVLTVRLPKAEQARPRQIPVRVAALAQGENAPRQITAEASDHPDGE
jgi:HSP20 family molecular chaperone IbpA